MHFRTFFFALASTGTASCAIWETLPPTPALPAPISNVKASINGVQLWYQEYNKPASPDSNSIPIVLIHGGLGYSAYFGAVISRLSQSHHVIAVDRRGHGRSTYLPNDVFTFPQFARDTQNLLRSQLKISSSYWVGWSDGAATTLAGLLDPSISSDIAKAFVFAGFQSYKDTNATFTSTPIYQEFVSRCAKEYTTLQPQANFTDFATRVATLEGTMPNWSDADLARISDGSKVMIVGAEHDEAVNLAVHGHLAKVIAGSTLKVLTQVSHFAPVQDPGQFASAVEEFVKA